MPVPAQTTLFNESTANGLTTVFPYEFMIASSDDITVELDGVVTTTGFTVTGVGDEVGGTIVFSTAPEDGVVVLRYLDSELSRQTDYQQLGDFNAETVDQDFDRIWIAMQSLALKLGLCIQVPISSTQTADELLESIYESAEAAALSETNAGTSETNASGFANDAETSALAAAASELAAAASAISAANEVGALAVSSGAALVGFTQSGTGAVAQTVDSKLKQHVSVKDFGAVGDGVTNDTAAINAAIDYIYARKVSLFFPAGTYLYDGGGELGNGNIIYGDGRNATVIKSRLASPTDGYLIRALGYGSGIRGIRFDADVAQTSGCYVWISGPETFIEDFYMTGDYNGVWMTGNVSRIRHGRFQDGASGAIRIKAEGGDNSQLIDDVLMGAQSPQISYAGIRVRNSSALIISNTSVIQQGHALLVDPTTNTAGSNTVNTENGSVASLWLDNCFLDNSGGNAIRISPSGDANVIRCRFSNVWASGSSGDGVFINNGGTGVLSGMHFESCHSVLNTESGYTISGVVSDIAINSGEICQNAHGVFVNNAITNFKLTCSTVGSGAGLSGNAGYGVYFAAGAAASDYILIANNTMIGNGTAAVSTSSVTGTSISVYGNIGDTNGTWVPTLTFDTPGDLAVTYAAQSGVYRRIGNVVHLSFVISTSSFTHTTASGFLRIGGLPYQAGVPSCEGVVEWQGITKASYTNMTLNLASGNSYMKVRASGSGVAISDVSSTNVPSGGTVTFRGSITYMV